MTTWRIERYILSKVLNALLIAFAVIAAVEMLVDFVAISRDVGARVDVTPLQVIALTLMQAPSVLLLLLPFVFLFGALYAYVGLNRRSELVAMRAAGISAWRFIAPAALAAFVIGLICTAAINPLASALNARYGQMRATLMKDYLVVAPQETWLRQGLGQEQVVIRAHSRDDSNGLVLMGVSVFFYKLDGRGAAQFDRRVEAGEARLVNRNWVMKNVSSVRPGGESEHSDTLIVPSPIRDPLGIQQATADSVSFWDLPGTIRRAEQAGLTATSYRLSFEQLLAAPLLYAAMAILAAAFSLRLMRLGGLAGLAGAGVALGFTFFFFNAVCGALGRADIVPTLIAAWTPPLIALLSGLTLLCYAEDG
ncbi:MAG TPA: LPS export ABC transporter permease LptG [Caulobacteraceae bacterium]|nr:LPS export ABC transporter permease LptG [Caulobacteraceae bacterium]